MRHFAKAVAVSAILSGAVLATTPVHAWWGGSPWGGNNGSGWGSPWGGNNWWPGSSSNSVMDDWMDGNGWGDMNFSSSAGGRGSGRGYYRDNYGYGPYGGGYGGYPYGGGYGGYPYGGGYGAPYGGGYGAPYGGGYGAPYGGGYGAPYGGYGAPYGGYPGYRGDSAAPPAPGGNGDQQ